MQAVSVKHPRVEIEYCTQCRWLLRAAWIAQELLTTQDEMGELALVPVSGGIFEVRIKQSLPWPRSAEGQFPEIKMLNSLRCSQDARIRKRK